MKIAIASDHAGFDLKSTIIEKFQDNHEFTDFGCESSGISVDYPDITNDLCQKYIDDKFDFGILICGSGIGVSIAANRHSEIRAALCHSEQAAILSRKHNDANILCLGARLIDENTAFKAVQSFLDTDFLGERHQVRVDKLS